MDPAIAEMLSQLNTRFYAEHAASFSATREAGWDGWEKLFEKLRESGTPWLRVAHSEPDTPDAPDASDTPQEHFARDASISVLDVACGNFRFERFLREMAPDVRFSLCCVDNCLDLVHADGRFHDHSSAFYERDVVAALLRGESPLMDVPMVDLAVCFGFMHHVPTQDARIRLACELLDHTCVGGWAAMSFWRFADEPARREKALVTTQAACAEQGIDMQKLDEGDYFLGWQNLPHAFRYCHSFSDDDIETIVSAVSPRISECRRFRADGKSGLLNEYLLLHVL